MYANPKGSLIPAARVSCAGSPIVKAMSATRDGRFIVFLSISA
jgi:hypothetical protein